MASTIQFPDIPPITKIPDIHYLPEFIHANLSRIIKQLKHNPTQLPPDICNNITPNQALDIIDTMEPHSPIPNQIFQQYVHAVSQLSPYQHYQQIQINTTILPKNNTNTNTPNHTQETYLQVNLTPEQHTIHITQHNTHNTIAKLTLHIKHTKQMDHNLQHNTHTIQNPTHTPDKHAHITIRAIQSHPLSISTIHCIQICILHPQPIQIPWTQKLHIDPEQTRKQMAAAILLWHINPQLK